MMDVTMFSKVILMLVIGASSCRSSGTNRLEGFTTVDDFMTVCLDSNMSKSEPGPEDDLFGLCSVYKDLSCCTKEVAENLHTNATWYKFSWDHCQQLSPQCKKHFQRDLCFYECSPNVGPWLVKEERKWRNERFIHVPLCISDCMEWFYDCQNDFTCVTNWAKDFSWQKGVQTCPTKNGVTAPCKRFRDIYQSAVHFCETVWDEAWKVVPDDEPCMTIRFEKKDLTHNREVAYQRAKEIVSTIGDGKNSGNHGPWTVSLCWLSAIISAVYLSIP